MAAQHSLNIIMTALLDNGAEVNKESSTLTAILATIENKDKELTKLLITRDASAPPYDRRKRAISVFYEKCKAEVAANANKSILSP